MDEDLVGQGFGAALEALLAGKKIFRKFWIDKGQYVWLLPGADVKKEWCRDQRLIQAMGDNDHVECAPCIRQRNALGQVVSGWLPTLNDLMATDWYIMED